MQLEASLIYWGENEKILDHRAATTWMSLSHRRPCTPSLTDLLREDCQTLDSDTAITMQ